MRSKKSFFAPSTTPPPSNDLPRPSQLRSQTQIRARPPLTVTTNTDSPQYSKKQTLRIPSLHTNASAATLPTLDPGSTSTARLRKSPSLFFNKNQVTVGNDYDNTGKVSHAGGILDLTSVQFWNTENTPGSIDSRNSPFRQFSNPRLDQNRLIRASPIQNYFEPHSVDRQMRSTANLETPMFDRETEKKAKSVYEKPIRSSENEILRYISKLKLIDRADIRKIRTGGEASGRKDLAITNRGQALNIPGLSLEDKEKLMGLNLEDADFFKQMETVLMDSLRRLERIERMNQEIELKEGAWVKMDADRLGWRYCYVETKGKNCPINVIVRSSKEIKGIKVLASRRHRKPNKFNFDFELENKRRFKLYERDKKASTFENPFYYLAICPDDTGVLSVKIDFGEEEVMIKRRSEREYTPSRSEQLKEKLMKEDPVEFSKEADAIKSYFKKKQLELNTGVDYTEQNKQLEQYTPVKLAQQRSVRKIKLMESIASATLNKNVHEVVKRQRTQAIGMRKDVQKALKDIMFDTEIRQTRKNAIQKSWLVKLAMFTIAERIRDSMVIQRRVEHDKIKRAIVVANIVKKMQTQCLKRGGDVESRLRLDLRMCLTYKTMLYRKHKLVESELIVMKFIQDAKDLYQLQHKFKLYTDTIIMVQTAWRNYFMRREGFKRLLGLLWDRNYERIFAQVARAEGDGNVVRNANIKSQFKKLNVADMKANEDAKERFMDDYLRICLARYVQGYSVYATKRKVEKDELKKSGILNMIRAANSRRQSELATNAVVTNKNGRPRISVMEQMMTEQTMSRSDIDENGSVVLDTKPPKLFILPTEQELDEAVGKVIMGQALATLSRKSILGGSAIKME